ncbi:MAG: elongation factor P maturation arginine rhamnosyltransferase EarP [Piscinibacter sp.]|nr:elongation factor P maturation arginine rhamnosyltransferase EarP [Piscinibacter sp.]
MQWDLFCHVVDNHGDLGVCWRLAADLGARGEAVRLWVDDPSALAWMAPQGAPGVALHGWAEAADAALPGDVVVETFGAAPPAGFVDRMARAPRPPLWINLEYLSAEPYVERSHRLPSPQRNGLTAWFFYPGFTAATGGLLREADLMTRRAAFDADAWLAGRGLQRRPGERVVSLFCYPEAPVPALLDALAGAPTLLLATPGSVAASVRAVLGDSLQRGALRAALLPWLTQRDYDHLLWSSDLNFVRGEDSFVRAQWAGAPFVWHIYPQHDGAHEAKLAAFLGRFLADAPPALARACTGLWRTWNGFDRGSGASTTWPSLPDDDAWRRHCGSWRDRLLSVPDLTAQLLRFVREKG